MLIKKNLGYALSSKYILRWKYKAKGELYGKLIDAQHVYRTIAEHTGDINFNNDSLVGVYSHLKYEPNITGFTDSLLNKGLRVATISNKFQKNQEPEFREISQSKSDNNNVKPIVPNILFVPAIALDSYGFRLGHGNGFYDKLLKKNPEIFSIGVCYKCNFQSLLPRSSLDIPVNRVILI